MGLLEGAEGIMPLYEHGYCVDDIALGLATVCREPSPAEELVTLARRYLYFLAQAQAPDGQYHNHLGHDRTWRDQPGTEDCWGRALWGLGTAAARGPTEGIRVESLDRFHLRAQLSSQGPHAMAFAPLGAADLLGNWPAHARRLALLAHASPAIGAAAEGWGAGERGAGCDEQPIEVAALADAGMRATAVTGDGTWLNGVDLCVAWFLGDNDARIPMLDERTGGGSNGLGATSRNRNQ